MGTSLGQALEILQASKALRGGHSSAPPCPLLLELPGWLNPKPFWRSLFFVVVPLFCGGPPFFVGVPLFCGGPPLCAGPPYLCWSRFCASPPFCGGPPFLWWSPFMWWSPFLWWSPFCCGPPFLVVATVQMTGRDGCPAGQGKGEPGRSEPPGTKREEGTLSEAGDSP